MYGLISIFNVWANIYMKPWTIFFVVWTNIYSPGTDIYLCVVRYGIIYRTGVD